MRTRTGRETTLVDDEEWVREAPPKKVSPKVFAAVASAWGTIYLALAAATPYLFRDEPGSTTPNSTFLMVSALLVALVIGSLSVTAAVIALRVKGALDQVPPSPIVRDGDWVHPLTIAAYPIRFLTARQNATTPGADEGEDEHVQPEEKDAKPLITSSVWPTSTVVTTRQHNRAVRVALVGGGILMLAGFGAIAIERIASVGIFGEVAAKSESAALIGFLIITVPIALGAVFLVAGLVANARGLEGEGYVRKPKIER